MILRVPAARAALTLIGMSGNPREAFQPFNSGKKLHLRSHRRSLCACLALFSAAACSAGGESGLEHAVSSTARTKGQGFIRPAVSTPAPIYTNAAPGRTYPISISSVGTAPQMTIVATIKCSTNTSGATIFAIPNGFDLEGGLCNGAANPIGASGAHFYNVATNTQAAPSTGLTAGTTYTIAGSEDGSNVNYYVCSYPPATCTEKSVASGSLAFNGTAAAIGGDGAGHRTFGGDIWSVALYNVALTATQVQSQANQAIGDPYGSPYPIYANHFSLSNNPFLMTFNQLVSAGASQPTNAATMNTNFWNQGAGRSQTAGAFPIYQGLASAPSYVVSLQCL